MASFHLARFPRRRVPRVMAGIVIDRRALVATPGLRFVRQLGTGRGRAMGLGADLRRWALFAVWEHEEALDAFLRTSLFARRWYGWAEDAYTVRLAPLAAHGTWGGVDPLAGFDPSPGRGDDGLAAGPSAAEPIAVLTRATIPARHWPAFHRAVPRVEGWLEANQGVVISALGVGERPVGTLATFSMWQSESAMRRFAYEPGGAHHDVVLAARQEGWFRDDLFARFRPYGEEGTWPDHGGLS
jgi:hypothetical protein